MLKRLRDVAIAALFGAGILAFGISVWSASSCDPREKYEQTTADQKTHQETCDAFKISPFKGVGIFLSKNAIEISAFITAFATICIAWFTLTLRQSTDQLRDEGESQRILSENTAERQLRAYVLTESMTVVKFEAGSIVEFKIAIKNTGQTPAHDVTIVVGFAWEKPGFRGELKPNGTPDTFSGVLGPGQPLNHPLLSHDLLAAEALQQIKDGKSMFFAVGKIGYIDAFSRERETDFRYCYNPRVGLMVLDAVGNRAT